MPPASPLAKPVAKLITQCPYCDHVSPVGSKFCGECGAALHLLPCPHCGAVNDITVATACYRCHRELPEKISGTPPAPPASAPVEAKAAAEEVSPYIMIEPSARQRPHALVVAIVLIAFSAASYYAYRQRSGLVAREPVPAAADVKGHEPPAESNTNAGTIVKAPAAPEPIPSATPVNKGAGAGVAAAAPVDVKAAGSDTALPREAGAAARSGAGKAGAARETIEPPAVPATVAPEIARARLDASKGLEKQTPNIGPCTDAVAALGLCTPEPTPKRQ